MMNRRRFLTRSVQASLATATSAFWGNSLASRAFAQSVGSTYKAIVVITLNGGNDANNLLVPLDPTEYAEYSQMRGSLALPISSLIALNSASGVPTYGMHPSLTNVAGLYNSGRALAVAGVGPMVQPATKAQIISGEVPIPASLLSHPVGIAQWESSQTVQTPTSGWGGRIADLIAQQSGSLPPVLNAGPNSTFTFGNTVQAIALQGGSLFSPLPPALDSAALQIAQSDSSSQNALVSQVAKFRAGAMQQQVLMDQAMQYTTLKTAFPTSAFALTMQKIAQMIGGRSVLGASRQIFYTQQTGYDTHVNQMGTHAQLLQDFDLAIGAFFAALNELGMSNQVLVCTHSDFSRSMACNTDAGSDHAWATHQLILGGGIRGGRIVGTMPDLELGGSSDVTNPGLGMWLPTTSVTQMASGIGNWFGLTASQLTSVFPDLANFPSGMVQLS